MDAAGRYGRTPLHEASSKGHLEIVSLLLQNRAQSNARTRSGSTPLHRAASNGHKEVVLTLLFFTRILKAKSEVVPFFYWLKTFLEDKFKLYFLDSFNVEDLKDHAIKGDMLKAGSRTFAWRIFLGLIPEEKNSSCPTLPYHEPHKTPHALG